ncbi:cytochrome c family protein [Vitiosangium sp. GDMCC 1.1324]|uniref:c-type cytochrome n=1 Tax=Vitiosangium sp. (strain GDMCC 1.1324) TaxID=2138576 RepID=UPI000D3C21C9|nr:hypothetical protein [Vitiosangium sp. GDMCC 1.1324]PTL80688.1 hypothetical protein DAT35_27665 [Vitiosangium sp. GDMCC 1.1324]
MFAHSWARALLVLVLLATFAGSVLVVRARLLQPRREAELGGLRLRLERAVWMHEPTDHGDAASLPSSEGAPKPGQRRLSVTLTLFNPGRTPRDFAPRELFLAESSEGTVWAPTLEGSTAFTLRPAELLPVTLSFDVPPTPEALRLEWRRGVERALLFSTQRPQGAAPPRAPVARWPRLVEGLPQGDAVAGSALYRGRLACISCHGNPAEPDSPRLGPSLGDFARVGATRVAGQSAAQYAYESLLDPNAFIAPECSGQAPCSRPSIMPLYGEVLSQQEMADLISYLVGSRAEE